MTAMVDLPSVEEVSAQLRAQHRARNALLNHAMSFQLELATGAKRDVSGLPVTEQEGGF
tara:strand:+ start:435 stop:611 length:177 start_codon:yes stop_codon:yes gene_type:complete